MRVDATRVERLGARPRRALPVALASGLLAAAACAGFVGPASASPTWSVSPSPQLTKAHGALSSVACTATSNCYALGWSNNPAGTKTVVEHWNGKAWSFIASPGGKGSGLVGHLSCPGAKSCWAVGGVFEHWNGAAWTLAPGPAVSGSAPALSSVSCASPTSCTAVGMVSQRSVGFTPLLEQLNGTTWSRTALTNVTTGTLDGVSCRSTTDCVAVGTVFGPAALAERWNGQSWTISRTPAVPGAVQSFFTSVSCPTATSCVAVGLFAAGAPARALAEWWNGKRWSIEPLPVPAATSSQLAGVSCGSATSCYAVGIYTNPSRKTLVEHWDGKTWSLVASPSPDPGDDFASGAVSCTSATTCFAVGERWTQGGRLPLIERGS